LQHIKADFLAEIENKKSELKISVDKSILMFNFEVQTLFKAVIKAFISGFSSLKEHQEATQKKEQTKEQEESKEQSVHFNFLSLKHALKRIYKACVI
jgi:hypothetical protein